MSTRPLPTAADLAEAAEYRESILARLLCRTDDSRETCETAADEAADRFAALLAERRAEAGRVPGSPTPRVVRVETGPVTLAA